MNIKRKGGLGRQRHRMGQGERRMGRETSKGKGKGKGKDKGKGIRDSNALSQSSGKQYLLSKLVAPSLVMICSKSLSGRQGLC